MKETLTNILLFIVAIAVIAIAAWYISPNGSVDKEKEYEILSQREIIDSVVLEDIFGSIVAYSYVGDKLPEKLAENEVVEMRTESSFTKLVDILNEGTEEEEFILDLVSYTQKTFIEKDGEWYYIEHGETPKDVFDKLARQNLISKIFVNIAYATTDTIYSASGDGYAYYSGAGSWAVAHDATSGTAIDYTATTAVVLSNFTSGKSATYRIDRLFLPFDTSSIPASATISSASLNVYVTATSDADNDAAAYITVVRTSQASHSSLVVADYDNVVTTEGIATGTRKDITSISTSAYLSFTLNSTGLGWIAQSGGASNCSATTGISCFGLREGHDNTNTANDVSGNNSITISTSENTGTSQDPYLSVTYTVPATFAPWMFSDF